MTGRWIPLVASALLGACSATQTRSDPPEASCEIGRTATLHYWEARHRYERVDPVAPRARLETRVEALDRAVLPNLAAAMDAAPCCPIFADRFGFILLTIAEGEARDIRLAEAERLFNLALDASEDRFGWTPGWLGLAEVHRRRAEFELADQCVLEAHAALDRLEDEIERGPEQRGGFIDGLLGLPPTVVDDTARRAAIEQHLILLAEAEAWSLDHIGLRSLDAAVERVVDPHAIVARLRARTEHERARIAHDRSGNDHLFEVALDTILRTIHPDFLPVQRDLATCRRSRGDHRRAADVLRAVLHGPDDLKASHTPDVWIQYASIHSDWYESGGDDDAWNEAHRALGIAADLYPNYAPTTVEFVRLEFRRALRDADPERLDHARHLAARLPELDAFDPGQRRRLMERIDVINGTLHTQ